MIHLHPVLLNTSFLCSFHYVLLNSKSRKELQESELHKTKSHAKNNRRDQSLLLKSKKTFRIRESIKTPTARNEYTSHVLWKIHHSMEK